jgi:hypothetical protein
VQREARAETLMRSAQERAVSGVPLIRDRLGRSGVRSAPLRAALRPENDLLIDC